ASSVHRIGAALAPLLARTAADGVAPAPQTRRRVIDVPGWPPSEWRDMGPGTAEPFPSPAAQLQRVVVVLQQVHLSFVEAGRVYTTLLEQPTEAAAHILATTLAKATGSALERLGWLLLIEQR